MSGPPDSQGTPLAWSHSHPSLHSPPSMSERELGGVLGSLPWGPPRHGKPVAWSPAAPRVVSAAPACLDPRPRAVLGCPPTGAWLGPRAQHRARHTVSCAGCRGGQVSGWGEPVGRVEGDSWPIHRAAGRLQGPAGAGAGGQCLPGAGRQHGRGVSIPARPGLGPSFPPALETRKPPTWPWA